MSMFVLVHGAWQTAATWDLVTPRLREAGHDVIVPALRGLENDANVLSRSTSLSTHIQDVVETLDRENLEHVILVGHSYAGMVITAVAEQVLHRLDRLVYVDAFFRVTGSLLWTFCLRLLLRCSGKLPPPTEKDGCCEPEKRNSTCGG